MSCVGIFVPPALSPDNSSYLPGQQSHPDSDSLPHSTDTVSDDVSVPPAISYPPGQQSQLDNAVSYPPRQQSHPDNDLLPQSSDTVSDDVSMPVAKQTKVHN